MDRLTGFLFFCLLEYFYLFYRILLKILDTATYPFSRLVDVGVNEQISWTVGREISIRECSALVGAPSRVPTIEHPEIGSPSRVIPSCNVRRGRLGDAGPFLFYYATSFLVLFLSLHPNPFVSLSFLFLFLVTCFDWHKSTCTITCLETFHVLFV